VLSGKPNRKDLRGQSLRAQAHLQFGHTLMWKNQVNEAKKAYASALTWNPTAVNLGQLMGMLGQADLSDVLEQGAESFTERYGKDDPRDATMLWWLGYTRFEARKARPAEEAFLAALKKAPEFANAWHYVAMARYDLKDYGGSVSAVLKGWDTDPAALVAEMQNGRDLNLAKLEYVTSWCVTRKRWADAAVLAELCAESAVDVARYWNNLGFFLREEGIRLGASRDEDLAAKAPAVFEQSLNYYGRALELEPEDPTYLNDTAVVLHYYLKRDFDEALALYERAGELAEARLSAGGLSPDEEDLARTALRDATNNLRRLRKLMDSDEKE
jgi:tetratricopeptide (TPR) repeat protein